ncbi:MAG: ATP-binding protein [Gammaproteobacteria bacterium]|nr:ATP-binding protein [Gammaproteobacteria bacterium]
MALSDRVNVAQRYQRAIRIDTDFGNPAALEGFICPPSSAYVLEIMANHALETGQGAFTWTGPYGGGKSSLAVVLGAMLNGSTELRNEAAMLLGEKTASLLLKAFPPRTRGWNVLPISGRRDQPVNVIGEAIESARLLKRNNMPTTWSEQSLLNTLEQIAVRNPRSKGGLAVFIDELGKFLESAARDGTDIHFFQQLAELASRSGGRLLVIGILHQAFEEYVPRLSREMRDEWSKVQGRFVDLVINVDGQEQIHLLSQAIESDYRPAPAATPAQQVTKLIAGSDSPQLVTTLEDCWPLHPVTTCLLGPLSRRRFGQNQRSLFGFLNSAEPGGFRDFLRHGNETDLYTPDRLWDYLRINLEPSILASPDGHRWALAADALGRCEAIGGTELHLCLLKIIALTDLLKERSYLPASHTLLEISLAGYSSEEISESLDDLRAWSLIMFRKFSGSWSIFEGSDFDIDQAVTQAIEGSEERESQTLQRFASLQPMVAKRHYHETGALRWFDVCMVPLAEIEQSVPNYKPRHGSIGCFMLAAPMQGESQSEATELCQKAAKVGGTQDIVIGLSPNVWRIPELAVELSALERVRDESPELQGDRVARTEVSARIAAVREQLESDLARVLDTASWYRKNEKPALLSRAELNGLASRLADERFDCAPVLHNELLGRIKPSSSAVAARNALLRRMVQNEREPRLGIKGFPAEGGLYFSLLKEPGLHCETTDGWHFVSPETKELDTGNLTPLWKTGRKLLIANSDRTVPISELYELWRRAPFGIKNGLLPVLSVAFMLSEQGTLAFYRQGIFRAGLSDLDIDYLIKNPGDIQVRWMSLTEVSRHLLSELVNMVSELNVGNEPLCHEPIDVARALVAIYDCLPPWVGRTQRLSRNAIRIRELFKHAKDPNKLIFDDMPKLLPDIDRGSESEVSSRTASLVREGLLELRDSYPAMLVRLQETLLAELQVATSAPGMLKDLRDRADNIRELGGDHRQEAFIMRLAQFEGTVSDIEGLAGMAASKPVHGWVDPDVDKAAVELATMAQRFVRTEAFAHVKGRRDKSHSMAVVVGQEGHSVPIYDEFQVSDADRCAIDTLSDTIDKVLRDSGEEQRNIVLAALAEVSARYLNTDDKSVPCSPNKCEAS